MKRLLQTFFIASLAILTTVPLAAAADPAPEALIEAGSHGQRLSDRGLFH